MRPERFRCGVYGILVRGGKVLMTRSIFLARHFVNFPGGGVELGESPMEALHREFREETGLAVKPLRILHASEGLHLSTQAPLQIVSAYWLVEEAGGTLRRGGNGDDVVDLFWTDVRNIPPAEMFPSDLEMARKLPALLA
ncbi:MAG: NUDIX hydrolase [Elusimicrobia bacterium]|nr:NUDIX hydrolase [Elusimicrobiota bacterium]